MKKNIFSVIITALTVINVVLTAIMFFVMMPTFQKTNTLITKVASVLNLNIDDEDAAGDQDYDLKDVEFTAITFTAQQTVNLAKSADGKDHYVLLDGFTIGVNKEADDYKSFKTDVITSYESTLTDIVRSVIQSHSIDEVSEELVKKEALEQIQERFDTKSIVSVTLAGYLQQ